MNSWFHAWRTAIRIARRDAWRNKGRSLLVLAMLALPIVGVSAADITLRTAELSPAEKLSRDIGRADARMRDAGTGGVPVYQAPNGDSVSPVGNFENKPYPQGSTDVLKAIPAGTTILSDTSGHAKLRTKHGLLSTEIREIKSSDRMVKGMMRLRDGRFPRKSDEVAATTSFLKNSGLSVGSTLQARTLDRPYTIVGSYELPGLLKVDQVTALPDALLAPLDKALEKAGLPTTDAHTTHLLALRGGFTWNMVKQINTKGVVVESRAVILDPPARSDVPLYQQEGHGGYAYSTGADMMTLAVVATVVGLAMLEICLLAGPAFAVGARRSRRQLGLVGANGGDRHHVRAIVLASGLVLGVAAALVGTALGMVLTLALRTTMEDLVGERFGALDIRPLELLGIALLAVITGLLAALVPAVNAARQPVLASLTGRRGVRRTSRVLPTIGLVAVALGAAIALYGSTLSDSIVIVGAGSAIAELGVVAMTPALVGLFGRIGRFLPLSPRLALRDAVRNRGRTAPAVAAVLAAVAGTVAVATYAASSDSEQRAQYQASMPHGAVSVMVEEAGGARDVPQIRAAVQKALPVDIRADVDRLVVGSPGCSMYGAYSTNEKGCGRYELVTPKANECPLWAGDAARPGEDPAMKYSVAERRELSKDWRCKEPMDGHYGYTDMLIGDASILKVLGITDPATVKAFQDGKALAFDHRYLDTSNRVGIKLITDLKAAEKAEAASKPVPGEIRTLTAHKAGDVGASYGIPLLIPKEAMKDARLSTVAYGAYYSTDKLPGSEQRQRLERDLEKIGSDAMLRIEEGYTSENDIYTLALLAFAGLITIGAAGIATGLAQSDAEADLKTLAAVGAPPRVRRTLSGFQCGVVAAMGVILGSVAGVLPAIGLRLADRRERMEYYEAELARGFGSAEGMPFVPIVIPWPTLLALLIVVPLGATLLAALLTRSRGALARRAVN
ncbi:FtsX-like permease family protein [Streptomyces sp. NPDC057638]|uniref:ABC transporter permease n=1 Tax=Streptomyces sp. NPDC057638 TaxID=3346190 RepID=UPI003698C0E3